MIELANQVAVITGASGGIGSSIAQALAAEGMRLCLLGRDEARLRAVAQRAGSGSTRIRFYKADLTREPDLSAVAEAVDRDLARVDVLVHAAACIDRSDVESTPAASLERQYLTNFRGPFLLTQKLLPRLREGRGQIVFINSTAGFDARGKLAAYAGTKHALKALADSLREEVNTAGVRVLSLFLGRTATPMQKSLCEWEGRPYRPELLLQPEDVAAAVTFCLRLPRTAEVTELRMRPLAKSY